MSIFSSSGGFCLAAASPDGVHCFCSGPYRIGHIPEVDQGGLITVTLNHRPGSADGRGTGCGHLRRSRAGGRNATAGTAERACRPGTMWLENLRCRRHGRAPGHQADHPGVQDEEDGDQETALINDKDSLSATDHEKFPSGVDYRQYSSAYLYRPLSNVSEGFSPKRFL